MGYKTLYFVAIASGAMASTIRPNMISDNYDSANGETLQNIENLLAMMTGTYGSKGIVGFQKLCPIFLKLRTGFQQLYTAFLGVKN